MAFFFAPYRIRGRPGRGVRAVLDVAGLARPARAALVVPALHVPDRSPTSDLERVPRRLPARRRRDAARDRGRGAPALRRRPDPRVPAAAVDRPALVQPLPLALPDLLRHPARPRRAAARLAADLVAPARAVVRRGRALVPLRRDADPRAARSAATSTRLRAAHGERRQRASRGAASWSRSTTVARGRRLGRRPRDRAGRDRATFPGAKREPTRTTGATRSTRRRSPRCGAQTAHARPRPAASGGTGALGRQRRHAAERSGGDRSRRPPRVTTTPPERALAARSSRSATR